MNPVNQEVRDAKIIAKRDRQVWLRAGDTPEELCRGWMTQDLGIDFTSGSEAVVYLDAENNLNGWWAKGAEAGVNQRHCDDSEGEVAVLHCREGCGLPWAAPAANKLLEAEERCLSCNGPLTS